jgi:ribosomal protein S9
MITTFEKNGYLFIFKKPINETQFEHYTKIKYLMSKINKPEELTDDIIVKSNIYFNTKYLGMKYL